MAFPSPSLVPPSLSTYQMSFGGLTFAGQPGSGNYALQTITWDMPSVASGDVQRAMDQGEFAGMDVLPGRDITVVQVVTGGYAQSGAGVDTTAKAQAVDAAVQALGGVMYPAGTTEPFPLYIQLPSGVFAAMCKPRGHSCPFDINRVFAGGVIATSKWHATDPRFYAAPSKQSPATGLPAPAGGGTFPATFNYGFGGGGTGGLVNVTNAGYFEMRPVLVITGPCTNPVVSNLSISGAPWVGVNITLQAGDTLTIDMDFRSVIYVASGTTQGASRQNALLAGSTWWNLQASNGPNGIAGPNVIEFTTSDGTHVAATLTVQSADAYLTL
jgi:hypothetical protein